VICLAAVQLLLDHGCKVRPRHAEAYLCKIETIEREIRAAPSLDQARESRGQTSPAHRFGGVPRLARPAGRGDLQTAPCKPHSPPRQRSTVWFARARTVYRSFVVRSWWKPPPRCATGVVGGTWRLGPIFCCRCVVLARFPLPLAPISPRPLPLSPTSGILSHTAAPARSAVSPSPPLPRAMGRLVAFVGAAPASAFRGAAVGRPSLSLRASRSLVCSPSRRPKAPRMMATEGGGEWNKSDKSKGKSSSSTATDVVDDKAAAAGFKVDATAEAATAQSDAPVTEFQPPSLNTTIFRYVAVAGARLGCMR